MESALEQAIALCYGKERTFEQRRDDARVEACTRCVRTAWQYVTLMHAAAVGGPRRPLRGIVEDVEDMRSRLTRERDEARARVAELEDAALRVYGREGAQARPSTIGPAGMSRATFHSARSISAIWPLASQDT